MMKDEKPILLIDQKLNRKYLDLKDIEFAESLENDYSIKTTGVSIDNEDIYFNNYKVRISSNTKSILLPSSEYQQLAIKINSIQSGCKV